MSMGENVDNKTNIEIKITLGLGTGDDVDKHFFFK